MNKYCLNCGSELREQSKFCSNCGLNTKAQEDAPQQSPAPDMPVQQQNTYNQEHSGVCQKNQNSPKFSYILFIFITSLIILLHFISRTLDMMISTLTWESFVSVLRLMITLAVFIVAITHFAAAVNSFYKQNPMKKRANSAGKLSALSLTLAILSTILFTIDIIIIFAVYYNGIPTNAFIHLFIPILVYDIFFVIFAFITMVKSNRFKAEINSKLYE